MTRPSGPIVPVPVISVGLVALGDHAVVAVQFADGRYAEVIRERMDGPFSHWVSDIGLAEAQDHAQEKWP